MKRLRKTILLVKGWWRQRFGFCPACNSDAPACDNCAICQDWYGRNRPTFPAPLALRKRWGNVFAEYVDKDIPTSR